MARPVIKTINAFDATKEHLIEFLWGENQIKYNTLTIRNNSSNTIIYYESETTMRLQHTIPANSLTNGVLYSATLTVTDYNDVTSEVSSPILFYCFLSPTWAINVVGGQEIKNSTYDVSITYSQAQGEQLQAYRVIVTSPSDVVIYDSKVRYNTSNMIVTISGLQDNNEYYIRATGNTINGMSVDTGKIGFTANFLTPDTYFTCSLENIYESGYVYISSNIISIEGVSDNNVTYINNAIADLTNNRVVFNKDFSLSGNFLMQVKGYGYKYNMPILYCTDKTNSIKMYLRSKNATYDYYELQVTNGTITYVIQSALITKASNNTVREVWIRRKNNLYNLEVI